MAQLLTFPGQCKSGDLVRPLFFANKRKNRIGNFDMGDGESKRTVGACCQGSSSDRATSRAARISRIGILIPLSFLATVLCAQLPSQSGNPAGVQSPSS